MIDWLIDLNFGEEDWILNKSRTKDKIPQEVIFKHKKNLFTLPKKKQKKILISFLKWTVFFVFFLFYGAWTEELRKFSYYPAVLIWLHQPCV